MVWVLALTGGIGFGLTIIGLPVIDNWGHFGGAVVGAVIGLADAPLLRRAGGAGEPLAVGPHWRRRWPAAWRWPPRIAESKQRQIVTNLIQQRHYSEDFLIQQLEKIRVTYRAVVFPHGVRRGQALRMPLENRTTRNSIVLVDPAFEFDSEVLRATIRLFTALAPEFARRGFDSRGARPPIVVANARGFSHVRGNSRVRR